jgi:hypothetical protein
MNREPKYESRAERFEEEELLRRRWRRIEEMILTVGVVAYLIISGFHGGSVLPLMGRWFV